MTGRTSYSVARACILFMLLCFIAQLARAQRDNSEGESWLRWSSEHRNAYVSGYIEGYYGGYAHGCQEGARNLSEPTQPGFDNFPVNKCLDRKLDFTKGIDLTKDVTTFYRRYPVNRNLFIKEILEELGKGKSLEDIHAHPPFPAVASSTRHSQTSQEK